MDKLAKILGIALLIILGIAMVGFIFLNYNADWTGFSSRPKDPNTEPARTLWDWLQILIIPIVLALVAYFFTRSERRTEQRIGRERDETSQKIAADDRREKELQSYFDKMTELLLSERMLETPEDSHVRSVGRARTLTVLRNLDAERAIVVLRFLREVSNGSPITDPEFGEPRSSSHQNAFLFSMKDATLTGFSFDADFSGTYLRGIMLREPDLNNIDLSNADLSDALLSQANLTGANFFGAYLQGTNFYNADFSNANLAASDFRGAILSRAKFRHASFRKTYLDGAFLAGADLTGARGLSASQLASVAILVGAIMPNGSEWGGKANGPYSPQELEPYLSH